MILPAVPEFLNPAKLAKEVNKVLLLFPNNKPNIVDPIPLLEEAGEDPPNKSPKLLRIPGSLSL